MEKFVPINKGNYSLDTPERNEMFEKNRAYGVEKEYKENRKDWEKYPKALYVSDYPLLVDVELSSLCNFKCSFCYTLTDEFKQKVNATKMDFGLYKKIIDEIAGKVFAIRLSLRGEPMIHPNFIEAIRYAKDKGIGEVSTLTNGSRLTPEVFEEAMMAGIDWITISFDGVGEEYNRNRFPNKFDIMMERLAAYKKIKQSHGRVKPVIKLQSIWPAIQENPTLFWETLAPVSDQLAFNPLIDFIHPKTYEETEFVENFSCPQIYQRLTIGADGQVLLCANDEENNNVIGNVNTQTVHQVWHGAPMNKVRGLHKKDGGFREVMVCRKCYLPRAVEEEQHMVNGRPLIVNNYK